jgi:rhomboid family GlyGly-CTERM serine protease
MFQIAAPFALGSNSSENESPADQGWILPAPALSRSGLTIGLAAVCLLIALLPGANDCLQFDRSAIAAGEWWRLFTGHLTHWGTEHLAWDLLVFVALGMICETGNRRQFVTVLAASSLAISFVVWALLPDAQIYRGLSGLDTALFASLAISMLIHSVREQRRGWSSVIAVLLISLMGKIALEMLTHRAFFVDASAAGFEPLPLSHLVGASVGITVGYFEGEVHACPHRARAIGDERILVA